MDKPIDTRSYYGYAAAQQATREGLNLQVEDSMLDKELLKRLLLQGGSYRGIEVDPPNAYALLKAGLPEEALSLVVGADRDAEADVIRRYLRGDDTTSSLDGEALEHLFQRCDVFSTSVITRAVVRLVEEGVLRTGRAIEPHEPYGEIDSVLVWFADWRDVPLPADEAKHTFRELVHALEADCPVHLGSARQRRQVLRAWATVEQKLR